MYPLRHYIDVTANGSNQDWSVLYASTAWESVLRNSADTDYIQSATLAHRSDFDCGNGPTPELGFIAAVTVHYRVRSTTAAGTVLIDVLRGGAQLTAGQSVALTASSSWTDGEYRVEVDSATSARFLASGMASLGCMIEVVAAPTSGYLEATQLWLEVEWVRSPAYYDPVWFAALPDAIVGDMSWATTGAQAAAITGNRLRLTDSSGADWRAYQRVIPEYGSAYTTEVTTRFYLNTTLTSNAFVYQAALVDDGTYEVELCCFLDSSGNARIGLITDGLDRSDETTYFASALIDWTADHHYRLVVDRDPNFDTTQFVRVYVDYSETPTLEAFYVDFTGTSGSGSLEFGTGSAAEVTAQCVVDIAYFDWWSYLREGDWRYWHTLGVGNNTVSVDTTDTFIAPPIFVKPPGIWTGQSDRCCVLNVQDLTNECSIWTYFATPDASKNYDLTIDYRMGTFGIDAKVSVQRTSDHWYWNNGGSVWQSVSSDVTLVYSPTRLRAAAMSLITNTADDKFIIKIRNDVGAGSSHNVYVYKVGFKYSP